AKLLPSIKIEDEWVMKGGQTELAHTSDVNKLKRFISKELRSKENLRFCREIEETSRKHSAAWILFSRYAEELILKVLNRTPLKGRCDDCPNIVTLPEGPDKE
ncbi:hypothetical protein MUP37_00740, partial [Candidatus Bathyarchaeota archaeon]|nr:hypothetical protein [Candidatus Bathyarchaeota archaeon]